VDVRGEVAPCTRDTADVRLTAELAFGTHIPGDPGDFVSEGRELVDHRVDGASDLEELAAKWPSLDLVRHVLRQIALGHRGDDASDFRRRTTEVVDQRVDGADVLGPRTVKALVVEPVGESTFATDAATDAHEVVGLSFLLRNDLVKRVDHG